MHSPQEQPCCADPRASLCPGCGACSQTEGPSRRPLHGFPHLHTPRRLHRLPTAVGLSPAQALGLLLEAGVSCLPVVDAGGVLLDVYARADITLLAKVSAGRWGLLCSAWTRAAC